MFNEQCFVISKDVIMSKELEQLINKNEMAVAKLEK